MLLWSGTTLVKRSDMIFFQSQNFGHGKFLSVCKSYTAYAKIFQPFSAFHLNKIELYILLFTERTFISKYKHIFLHFLFAMKIAQCDIGNVYLLTNI